MVETGVSYTTRRCSALAGVFLAFTAWGRCHAQTVPPSAHWVSLRHLAGVVDLGSPRRDGWLTASAGGLLYLFRPSGAIRDIARGPGGYGTNPGTEAYLVVVRRGHRSGARCRFRRDDVYALEVVPPGIVTIDVSGQARPFATLPPATFPNGITFDQVGRFGHRLLVTAAVGDATNLYAIDCGGGVRTLAENAPRLEGGIAVAPRSFGNFGGQLIAPDEYSGRLVAIDAQGTARTVTESGLATGADIGVESLGFVPFHFDGRGAAFLADRGTPGNPHPGTDSILMLPGKALVSGGVRGGDLLVATEGGADTIRIRCRRACTARRVADGPPTAHAEGHIVFVRRP